MVSPRVRTFGIATENCNKNKINEQTPAALDEVGHADHSWRQQNRIWTDDELKEKYDSKTLKHKPVTFSDHLMASVMRTMYITFNALTGYTADNPKTRSIEWRLIVLESVAGVPGFIAAGFRHFYSLRTLQRDHGE